jgi:hypothetical protein
MREHFYERVLAYKTLERLCSCILVIFIVLAIIWPMFQTQPSLSRSSNIHRKLAQIVA